MFGSRCWDGLRLGRSSAASACFWSRAGGLGASAGARRVSAAAEQAQALLQALPQPLPQALQQALQRQEPRGAPHCQPFSSPVQKNGEGNAGPASIDSVTVDINEFKSEGSEGNRADVMPLVL